MSRQWPSPKVRVARSPKPSARSCIVRATQDDEKIRGFSRPRFEARNWHASGRHRAPVFRGFQPPAPIPRPTDASPFRRQRRPVHKFCGSPREVRRTATRNL